MSLAGLVTRSRVSPITSCSVICAPNNRLATLATVWFLSACVPVDDMVAEVPMHTSWWACKRSRKRRTSKATSAPWRPR